MFTSMKTHVWGSEVQPGDPWSFNIPVCWNLIPRDGKTMSVESEKQMEAQKRKPHADKDQRSAYSYREQIHLAHHKMFSYHIYLIFILSTITKYFISFMEKIVVPDLELRKLNLKCVTDSLLSFSFTSLLGF